MRWNKVDARQSLPSSDLIACCEWPALSTTFKQPSMVAEGLSPNPGCKGSREEEGWAKERKKAPSDFDMKSSPESALSTQQLERTLLCILNICKDMLGRPPKVVGIDVVEMALWAKENTPAVAKQQGTLQDGPVMAAVVEDDMKVTVERELVSQAEEGDMEALLGTYVMGIGEAETFSERLKRELQALEAANVHAILENEPLINEKILSPSTLFIVLLFQNNCMRCCKPAGLVLRGLDAATYCVEDMDEWLNIFNVKLRHMREDIESIETRNNKLEMQSVNNKSLIEENDKLLEKLHIPSEYAACLTGGSFDEAHMLQNIEACEWLANALQNLEVPKLDRCYANMRAVREKRTELDKLKNTFVKRASEFLRNYFASLVDFMISDKSYFSQRGQLQRPDHADLRYKCRTYARCNSLDKNCLGPLRKAYCSSLNLLLRREAREFANELRASTKASRNPTVWLDGSTGSNQSASSADTSTVSEAYEKMLTIYIPLLVDESSFFAHCMCFEVPALVPPGGLANGNKTVPIDDDDLGIMDIDDNDKAGEKTADLQALNESLHDLLDGIQEIMLCRIIYCTAVLLATASVILLALFSPLPHRKPHKTPHLALSFYIQQPQVGGSAMHSAAPPKAGALIFHRTLTEGPENTSRVVGKAQGFIIPVESFAYSAFNIIYLTFHTHEYSGSVSIQAKNFGHKETEELAVVGGTGSFSFARGLAVFAETNKQTPNLDATYLIKLHLKFPNRSQTIPG
ncbi:Exocyst complex component SEC3A [Sesamum alatum]|uniref:Exocyst complex component SEC3A n=1 Tax=Sesamum alatum TaxID=300844 RepID=A0AAE2CU06_9LAMI|nr:Exocyst complex component SEC3A [Sesamum alatum]